jgi:ATP-dependent protease HslVU (ClpYQ) ATPase subunit
MPEKSISRAVRKRFKQLEIPQKVLLLVGARGVGKTELVRRYL